MPAKSLNSFNVTVIRAKVPPSADRIFSHTVPLDDYKIKDTKTAVIIATPQTDFEQIEGIVEPYLNSVSVTVGVVQKSEITFCFRRNDYFESRAPGMFINIMIME